MSEHPDDGGAADDRPLIDAPGEPEEGSAAGAEEGLFRYIWNKGMTLIELGRPMPFPPHVISSLSGTIMAYAYFRPGLEDPGGFFLKAVAAGLLVGYANAASNIYNQVTDIDIDRINKPSRPIPSGRITKRGAALTALILYLGSMFLSFAVNIQFGMLISLFILLSIMYSTPPLQLKKRLWFNNLTIALARGALLPMAGWVVVPGADAFDPPIMAVAVFLGVFLLGASATKDFGDVEGDRKYGMETLPIHYGLERAAHMVSYFFVFPFISIPLFVFLGALPLGTLLVTVMVLWGLYVGQKLQDLSFHPEEGFENTGVWTHMYYMLIASQVLLALTFTLG
ncbi:MAG: UbiA family prenyltransferase [Thermoplasmata archaeon]|nr:UbiA family prenyltransferase [Thermoplasmata archaeon]